MRKLVYLGVSLLVLLFYASPVWSQYRVITGTVTAEQDQPMLGVSILNKTTGLSTLTQEGGKFSITAASSDWLSFSFVGYQTQEIQPNNQETLTVQLVKNVSDLESVVVVGYGTQKKKLVTGATVQIKGSDIAKLNTVDVVGALQSQSPGVNIVQNNGFLGQGFKINIRGIGTNGNSGPLFVVDGVANGSIDGLNPSDIESIDILKDAASAAIYGARAANGVILVSTKRGKGLRSYVAYDGYFGAQNVYKMPTILNAQEFMQIQDEGRVMDGLAPYNWRTFIPAEDLKAIEEGRWKGTNWLKEINNKNAPIQNHALNFSGGNDRSNFALGLAYTNQEASLGVPTAFPELNRYNLRINSDHVVLRKGNRNLLTVGETINYRYSETQGSFGTGGIYWNGIHNMLVMSPLMHIYNPDGAYYVYKDRVANGYNWDISNGADKNPVAYLDYFMNQNKSKSHYLQSSFYAALEILPRLTLKSQLGYIMGGSSYRAYVPTYELTQAISNSVDRVSQSMSLYNRYSIENTLQYILPIRHHQVDLLLGQSIEKWGMGESMSATKVGSSFDDFEHAYLSNVATTSTSVETVTGSPFGDGALASFFGRANYNYKEKYMASAIVRYDGSSVFANGHRFGFFPSFSAGWNISNESFMENLKAIDFLKLRASWGQNGNNAVSTFQWLSLITSNNTYGGYTFGNLMNDVSIGSYAFKLTNPNLTWETQEQLNIGADMRFLKNRLFLEIDWYHKMTRDWLVTAPVLYSFGASAPAVNGGDIQNKGLEVALHWNENFQNDFRYGIHVNMAANKNKVTRIANMDGIIHGPGSIPWEGADETYRIEVGYPIGYFYGYKSSGIFQNQQQIDAHKGPLLNGAKTQPGDVIWADHNGDGLIDAKDRTMIGDPNPDFTLGFSFNVGYKAVDLAVNSYGAFGQQILKVYRDFATSPLNNYTTDIFERWHGEGTSNTLPRLTSAASTNWTRVSDIFIEDGSYLKIKNITLGLDLKKVVRKIPLDKFRLYAAVQNLFTFTKYSGMDPEIGFGGESAPSYARGIDLGYYPSARNFLIGVNIQF